MSRYKLSSTAAPFIYQPNQLSVNHKIVVTDDGHGVASALVKKLKGHGYQAELAREVPATADTVILLHGLQRFNNIEQAVACNFQAFCQARTIAPRFTRKGGIFITVQDTGGNFALHGTSEYPVWAAGLAGLVKTAALEWPKAVCKAIDLQQDNISAEILAERLLPEIFNAADVPEVGLLANGERVSIHTVVENTVKPKFNLDKNAVLVVSGGGRGVTAACIIALAKLTQAKFVLLGRTALQNEPPHLQNCASEAALRESIINYSKSNNIALKPTELRQQLAQILAGREIKASLEALKAAGSEVCYFDVDIQDPAALNTALAQVRQRWKKITGVIHGAGILADKLIAQKSDEQFHAVFNTKVIGLKNLLQATHEDTLEIIALFSSVAGRFGNVGQCDYAMANEVLNKVAQNEQRRRGKKCHVKSINWGPWEGGMVTPQLKALFLQKGIALVPVAAGAAFFVNELGVTDEDSVEIIYGSSLQTENEEFYIQQKTHPFLLSHTINDVPVLPACLVLEWFVVTAKKNFPALSFSRCENFKVLRGVRLINFKTTGHRFKVAISSNTVAGTEQSLSLQLTGENNTVHYSAKIIMQPTPDVPPSELFTLATQAPWPWDIHNIYLPAAAHLFHGPDFQVIQSLDGISADGGTGQLTGIKSKKWPDHNWQIDVAALDGILQLVRLWGIQVLNKPTLPTQIGAFMQYQPNLASGTLRCIFQSRIKDKYRTESDALLMTPDNQVYAQMQGIEMCATAY